MLIAACGARSQLMTDGEGQSSKLGGSTSSSGGSGGGDPVGGTPPTGPVPCTGPELFVEANDDCAGKTPCYSSVQAAVEAAEDGATIWVLPGTYYPGADGYVVKSVTGLVCVRSVNGPDVTTLDGNGERTVVYADEYGFVWVDGFTIRGAGPESGWVTDGYAVAVAGFEDIDTGILNNHIEDNTQARGAIYISPGTVAMDLTALISGNIIRGSGGASEEASVLVGRSDSTGFVRIENNLIVDDGEAGLLVYADGGSCRVEIVNNTIARNREGLVTAFENVWIDNNIIALNEEVDARQIDFVSGGNLRSNLFGTPPDFGLGGTDLTADAMFVGVEQGDYHLLPGSPACATGTAELAPAVDLDGAPRDSAAPDIGAFACD